MSTDPLPIVQPGYPDFHLCDAFYGGGISSIDCGLARLRFPRGEAMVEYTSPFATNFVMPYVIPFQTQFGALLPTIPNPYLKLPFIRLPQSRPSSESYPSSQS